MRSERSASSNRSGPSGVSDLPTEVAELLELLTTLPGTEAIALGGSRALGTADAASDWDLGLYYRGTIDLTRLAERGTVFPPGSWGRLMNGGAWLRCGEHKVDVLLRDLDVVEHWTARAEQGEFERDALLGYLAGVPTYLLMAELASCRAIVGTLPSVTYPERLAAAAPGVWRFCRGFSLDYARAHAQRGNAAGAMGMVASAVMEEAHARLAERRVWTCNEKRMIDVAGMGAVQELFARVPADATELAAWIDEVGVALA